MAKENQDNARSVLLNAYLQENIDQLYVFGQVDGEDYNVYQDVDLLLIAPKKVDDEETQRQIRNEILYQIQVSIDRECDLMFLDELESSYSKKFEAEVKSSWVRMM